MLDALHLGLWRLGNGWESRVAQQRSCSCPMQQAPRGNARAPNSTRVISHAFGRGLLDAYTIFTPGWPVPNRTARRLGNLASSLRTASFASRTGLAESCSLGRSTDDAPSSSHSREPSQERSAYEQRRLNRRTAKQIAVHSNRASVGETGLEPATPGPPDQYSFPDEC